MIIDCDLQHPPETIIEMYKLWQTGDVDIVEAKKRTRGNESTAHRGMAKLFYKIIQRVSGLEMEDSSDFKLLDRRAVEALLRMPERLTFFRAMSSWVGFKTECVYFDVAERQSGSSKFGFASLVKYAVTSITSFTSAPMQMVTVAGVVTFSQAARRKGHTAGFRTARRRNPRICRRDHALQSSRKSQRNINETADAHQTPAVFFI